MRDFICPNCDYQYYSIIMSNGNRMCPICKIVIKSAKKPHKWGIGTRVKHVEHVDLTGTIDFISAQIMAKFINRGMSISNVARQMGITTSTIYTKLAKYDMIILDPKKKIELAPTVSDLFFSGATNRCRIVRPK